MSDEKWEKMEDWEIKTTQRIEALKEEVKNINDWINTFNMALENREVLRVTMLKLELVGGYMCSPSQFKHIFDDKYWNDKKKLDSPKQTEKKDILQIQKEFRESQCPHENIEYGLCLECGLSTQEIKKASGGEKEAFVRVEHDGDASKEATLVLVDEKLPEPKTEPEKIDYSAIGKIWVHRSEYDKLIEGFLKGLKGLIILSDMEYFPKFQKDKYDQLIKEYEGMLK